MAFQISVTEIAESHLRTLPARDQRVLEASIQAKLAHQPTTQTKAIRRLRPNPSAEFELRVGDLRVLYNVTGEEVVLLVIGRKVGNKLLVAGEEFHGHRDNPAESPGSEPPGDAG